jgi:aerobic carbon-monoxide dehydrogenase large subunit
VTALTAPVEVEVGRVVGSPVRRKEDAKLIQGQAQWVDNMHVPGTVYLHVVRSPYAHAGITRVDVAPALAHAGVVAAWSGADLADEWQGSLPCAWIPTEDTCAPDHWPLAVDIARYAGDAVAVVAAESRSAAADAVELVEVDYEPLPAVADAEAALGEGAPLVHEQFGTNRCYTWKLEAGEVDRLFAEAAVTVRERYRQNRLIPNAIEPRAVFVTTIPATGEFTLWSTTQVPHIARVTLSGVTGIPEAKLRVIAPDVGGGFGSKLNVYAEEALALAIARRLGRPVKWTETRSEGYVATIHGRDQVQEIELAATAEGRITAVRTKLTVGLGAYLQLVTPGIPLLGAWLYGGAYAIEGYSFECVGVFTNTVPTDAYRGAGRPEATYAIERAVDALARKLDKDPAEVRRLNFIRKFPATIASGLTIDSGDYHASLDVALEQSGYEDVRAEQRVRRAAGDSKRLGIGLSTYVEMCGLAPSAILGAIRYSAGGWDTATVRCLPTGTAQVLTGTSPHGQGHETTWSQIAADQLGYGVDEIEVLHGDTAVVPLGMDTYGSRSLAVGGVALYYAAERIIEKARKLAAHLMGVDVSEVEHARGTFTGPEKTLTLKELAFAAWSAHSLPEGMEPGLEASYVYDPPNFSWPAGAHVAVVEVDTETGLVELVRYVAVDDVGTVVNPMIVDGQIHGGLAQGVAQALYEEAVYDEDGNLMTANMTSYLVPSAAEFPRWELHRTVTPSPTNPLGVKGVGETGAIASPPAVMNAVLDALAEDGVTDIDMPALPERVWKALQEARR